MCWHFHDYQVVVRCQSPLSMNLNTSHNHFAFGPDFFIFHLFYFFFCALLFFFLFCFIFFTDIKWPASLKDVEKVEKQNNLAINVFGYENGSIYPLHLTKSSSSPINLLLISEEEDGQTNTHYCWIKDFDRLCYDQTKHRERKHFCLRCFSSFNSKESLARHADDCLNVMSGKPAKVEMPAEGETLSFSNHRKMLKVSMNSMQTLFLHGFYQ